MRVDGADVVLEEEDGEPSRADLSEFTPANVGESKTMPFNNKDN
jgi:hypothetical protein